MKKRNYYNFAKINEEKVRKDSYYSSSVVVLVWLRVKWFNMDVEYDFCPPFLTCFNMFIEHFILINCRSCCVPWYISCILRVVWRTFSCRRIFHLFRK